MMMERARADRFQRRVSFMESGIRLSVEPVDSSSISVNQVPHYGLNEALAASKANSTANALEAKSQSQNGSDSNNGNGGDGNGGDGNGGDGNGGNGNGGNGNPNENNRGTRLVARECTYQDFMKC
ncbi:hypothetical protein Tco_1102884 [Tanacetum coccineum]